MHCFYQFLLMSSIFTRILSLAHLFYAYFTHGPNKAHPHSTTILGEPGSPKRDVLYNGKGKKKEGKELDEDAEVDLWSHKER